jgi:hypothetical protein
MRWLMDSPKTGAVWHRSGIQGSRGTSRILYDAERQAEGISPEETVSGSHE